MIIHSSIFNSRVIMYFNGIKKMFYHPIHLQDMNIEKKKMVEIYKSGITGFWSVLHGNE